jgi:integrase
MAQGNPLSGSRVFPGFRQNNWSKREWDEIRKAAGAMEHRFYDLRHCYASYLLTAGRDESYLTRQLGHAPEVFRKHYGRYIPATDSYVEAMPLAPGEVPADLLARLDRWDEYWRRAAAAGN